MVSCTYFHIMITFPITAFCVDAPKVFIEPENLLKPYLRKARGTIIILHGHGSTGSDIRFWMSQVSRWNIRFRHIRAIFPTGVVRAHRPGETNRTTVRQEQNAWYFKKELELRMDSIEENDSLQTSMDGLSEIIKKEVATGVPLNKIIIGGHTMGGIMAMHMAFRVFPDMAGVFGLSTFLPRETLVYKDMKKQNRTTWPSAYFSQGIEEVGKELPIVNWTRETIDELHKFGVKGELHIIGDAAHSLSTEQMNELWKWVLTLIPLPV